MNFLHNLFGKKTTDMSSVVTDEDNAFLQAEPISRKRMDLLWLDPPRLAQLKQPIMQAAAHHKVATVTLGDDSSNLRTHEITQEDFEWAKQVELIVDKAFSLGQRKKYRESIQQYKIALKLAPGCDLFLMSIGACYANLLQKAEAVQYLERAAQISPGNSRIRDTLNNARRMKSNGPEPSQPAVAPSIEKKLSADNQQKKTVASESNAEWSNKPLHCPKCNTKLHDKTPRFGMIRNCSNCGASFTISNYIIK
jgi:tetratricopeptide (TPR) repeat protein